MKRIFLIGYMGAGKTTVGKVLSQQLELSFIDLDHYIEGRYHKTVGQLFAERGEEAFRDIERRMLREVAAFEDVLVSTGGGAPCFFDNIEFMNSKAQTIYLKATPEILFQHLKMGKNERPLLKNKTDEELMQFITESLATREPYYSKADYIFDITLLNSIDRIKDSVHLIQELLNKKAE